MENLTRTTVAPPDLSARPLRLTTQREMKAPPGVLYQAWTELFDRWFAAPGPLLMKGEVNAVLCFETHFEGKRMSARS